MNRDTIALWIAVWAGFGFILCALVLLIYESICKKRPPYLVQWVIAILSGPMVWFAILCETVMKKRGKKDVCKAVRKR